MIHCWWSSSPNLKIKNISILLNLHMTWDWFFVIAWLSIPYAAYSHHAILIHRRIQNYTKKLNSYWKNLIKNSMLSMKAVYYWITFFFSPLELMNKKYMTGFPLCSMLSFISASDKDALVHDISQLSSMDLSKVIQLLEYRCPAAVHLVFKRTPDDNELGLRELHFATDW